MQAMVKYLSGTYEGRDHGEPDKPVGTNLHVTEESIALDQSIYTEMIFIKGMGSTDVKRSHIRLDHEPFGQARR